MDTDSQENSDKEEGIYKLPNEAFLIIFSNLSWMDIVRVKSVSTRFYNIVHTNYHKLSRREVYEVAIKYNKKENQPPFYLKMAFNSRYDSYSSPMTHWYFERATPIESKDELLKFLKIYDMRNLNSLDVPYTDDFDIFDIFDISFQIGTNINRLTVDKLDDKNFASFQAFIKKFSSIKNLIIKHVYSEIKIMDLYSYLSSLPFKIVQNFDICEYKNMKLLSEDLTF